MRRISLNARTANDQQITDETYVVLILIEHEDLEKPLRLSTDPTERLSTDPLSYCTRSHWLTANPDADPFLFVLASANRPSDLEDAPAEGQIVLEIVDNGMAEVARSITDRPSISIAVVLASSPDLIEAEWTGMVITTHNIKGGEMTLSFSREDVEDEYCPSRRMTKDAFPGLHR
ncbi:hypothetical protein [Rhizobium halophytocola]|uniref:DUF1833 domain-containing protein n=1 Tax=Rhizobium halophytocola TaxID=735519 RepID=A0ABS4E403_9HYPH|nr:hypothetical protein [Rhizobium halophytocola]MBP1852680.1 hypothetical protein [Rhizobium halophytocola]